jgi:hypothetical protein
VSSEQWAVGGGQSEVFFRKSLLADWLEFNLTGAFLMQSEAPLYQPVNHVFVDLENVKSIDAAVVGGKNLTLHLFLGPHNKKLDVDVVEKPLGHS